MSANTAVRVSHPPGGASTISFGTAAAPAPPAPAAAEPAPVAAVPAEAPVAVVEDDGPSLESLKLKAITAVASATDGPAVRSAITTMLKELQIANTSSAAGAGASTSRSLPTAAAASGSAGPSGSAAAGSAAVAAAAGGAVTESSSLAALKAALNLRGTHGIISIGKKFRSMDDNGDHKLAYDEFKKALLEMSLGLSETEMTKLFRYFDKDGSGFLSFDEVLIGLRGDLNERRLDMVKRCFKVLDKTGDGQVTLADLEGRYDASRHPDVIAGTKTQRQVLLEFLSVFEAQGGGTQGDGVVTIEEFMTYYMMISASIDGGKSGDDYFELMMRNVWHVSGGEGWCANTTCKRVLVVFEDGTQQVIEVTDDFDVDTKDLGAVRAKLTEQGLTNIKTIALYGDMTSESGPSTSLAAAAPLRSPGATPGPGGVAGVQSQRPSTGRRTANPDHNRSSIMFG